MRGDDRRRFCDHCKKFVHNVSAMSQPEREAFASPANAQECIFYCQRDDGKIADLSFLTKLRRWFPFLRLACWSTFVALLPLTLTGCMGVRPPQNMITEPTPQTDVPSSSQTTNQISGVDSPR
jgi:hypothetical protein